MRRFAFLFLTTVLILGLVAGCASHKSATSAVKMELSRELVLVPPEIRSLSVTPRGEVDTWKGAQSIEVVLEGDPGLAATVEVPLLHRTVKLAEQEPGVYRGKITVPARTTGALDLRARLRHEETGAENVKEVRGAVTLVARKPAPPPKKEPAAPVCTADKRRALEKELASLVPHFAFASAELDDEGKKLLQRAATVIRKYAPCKVHVLGFTDLQGPDDVNNTLSIMRAQAVRSHLVALGIPPERLLIKGYGKRFPLSREVTIAAHRRNRRVEIHAIDPYAGS